MLGRIITAVAVCCISFQVNAQNSSYLDELIVDARLKNLAQHKEWLKMLHYKDNLFSGHTSEIITPEFFNAPDGMSDPNAELEATLASFFSDLKETDKQQNPQCQFIYRYRWLDEHLNFDNKRMKRQTCKRFNKWLKVINPEQITLVFPAGTENSPASMFGHTLFRIDKKGQTDKSRLFSYSINFAADTDETNGLVFAYKGVFGGYPGSFSVMPYYEKVKQYNEYEHRDIWEYQLNLTDDEILRVLQHTWELGSTKFAYYFFLENCSYQLLALLDVARPGHNLTEQFSWWALPSDTVAAILEDKGILNKTVYRPSIRTSIRHQVSYLSSDEQDVVLDIVYGRIKAEHPSVLAIPEKQRALIFVTAYDYLRYLYFRNAIPDDGARGRMMSLLRSRNKVPLTQTIPNAPKPEIRFDQGHATSRFTLGGGYAEDMDGGKLYNFSEIAYRPVYHSLIDLDAGYTKGAQVNFGRTKLRYNHETDKIQLHEFMLIDIFSLATRDKFFKPLSWKIQTGFVRRPVDDSGQDKLTYSVYGGAGLNFGLSQDLSVYAMLDVSVLAHHRLEHDLTAGAGPGIGMLWKATRFWNIWLSGSVLHYQDNRDLTYVDYKLEQNIAFTTNSALRIAISEKGDRDKPTREYNATDHWYF